MIWKDCAPWTNTISLVKMFFKSGVCQKLFGIVRNTELCLQIHVGWLGRSGGVWVCWLVPLLGIPWEGQTVPTGLTTDPHHPVHGPHPPLQPHHPLHGQQGCRHPQGRQQDRLSWARSLPVCQNHFFPIFSESPHSLSLYLLSLHLPVKHILKLAIFTSVEDIWFKTLSVICIMIFDSWTFSQRLSTSSQGWPAARGHSRGPSQPWNKSFGQKITETILCRQRHDKDLASGIIMRKMERVSFGTFNDRRSALRLPRNTSTQFWSNLGRKKVIKTWATSFHQ